ncbi:MAG: FG-GAP repeat protein [Myxococcaceae bacterium]|nr:FG-GAP repeat protein [Myxococcaceae bacterium]
MLAVGAPGEDGNGSSQANNSALEAGAAYLFRRLGSAWTQQAYLKTFGPFQDHVFGSAVALSGDGTTLAVGSPGFSFDRGVVDVFSSPGWALTSGVSPTVFRDEDRFGASVAISGDGTTLVVGSPGDDSNATGVNGTTTQYSAYGSGAAYVFTRSPTSTSYTVQAFLKGPFTSGSISTLTSGDGFGNSVSVSRDGHLVVIGAFGEDSNATGVDGNAANNSSSDSGAAFVFGRVAGVWSQRHFVKASNTDANDFFAGRAVVSRDGNTLVCGAGGEDSAASGINGDQSSNALSGSGAAYVFVP